ncbi:MAG TPA: TM0106 family RecB-like putative nuclease [Candidatus Polarisedimenticolaceae bacterium]|nr:TM0106 family RecB-like putative nuclease [Candidatus Polarisedimenticolaceae bacterium]
MASPTRTDATILAHHLYDFAECEHRITLDTRLDKSRRTPPDAAMELLFERGRRFEREVVEPLGYPAVDVRGGEWDEAFERTVALMREGVDGIDQGVLIDGPRLARPDLLERVSGASALGEHHYRPGDVKSARMARSDAVLQVGFAALLLETIQGRRPESGFLILGDRRREELDLEAIRCTIDDAVERAEAIARGEAETTASYSTVCARCRWRGECLPVLQDAHDVSFVHGLTRARQRVLRRHGIGSIDALAGADLGALIDAGVPADGLERAQAQARAMLDGQPRLHRVRLPRGVRREAYLKIEIDPLEGGEPWLMAWAEAASDARAVGEVSVAGVAAPADRAPAFERLMRFLESPAVREAPVFTYGSTGVRAFDALAEANGVSPQRAGEIGARFVDLAPWVRRAGVLPVFHYRFDEVVAVARGGARPAPGAAEDAGFVRLQAWRERIASGETVEFPFDALGREAVESLFLVRAWLTGR